LQPERLWFLAAVIIYGIGLLYSIFVWRRGFQKNNWTSYILVSIAFIAHTLALTHRGFSLKQCPVNNLYEATTFILWTISLGSLIFGIWPRLRFIGVFTAPLLFCVGVFAMMPGLDPEYGDQPNFINGWSSLHAALIMLGYGAFGLSAITGSMFLTQERNIKLHRASALFSMLPSIQRLEKLITQSLVAGLILLTSGLFIGGFFLDLPDVLGKITTAPNAEISVPMASSGGPAYITSGPELEFWKNNPDSISFWNDSKVIWSLLVWTFYTGLLIAHIKLDQRGRRYAWLAIFAFFFVIFTFWGTNLLSSIHNPKS
tara:strand:+ start:345 stop:1289 length:945 start_codon:yes stop_codon:yes gene_type:complete